MKPLPEERLLKLLRAKPRLAPAAAGGPGPSAPAASSAAPAPLLRGKRPVVELAVYALGAVLVVEAAAVIAQLVRPLPPVSAPAVQEAAVPPAGAGEPPAPPSVAASAPRPLFTPPADAGAETARRAPPSGAAKELSARLTLLGIIAGTPPQAIIEDSGTKKSYFVAQGQSIVEGAVLDAVFDTYVVLDLSGEKFELRL